MGLALVLAEAKKLGFGPGDPSWINLGNGQPESGALPGSPERISAVSLEAADHAYGPMSGTPELREAVAAHYRRLYGTPYQAENVAIVQGGRLALSRVFAALGTINTGYLLPDYSAYEDLFGGQLSRVTPIPIRTNPKDGFRPDPAELGRVMTDAGLGALLMSNPQNPTGAVLTGPAMAELVARAREAGCALLLDEFYSHFVYPPLSGPVSAAQHVTDVNADQVLIFDGLTKNFRYPGWRVAWVLGPAVAIATLDRVGAFLDGGPSLLAQRAALRALEPGYADQETAATRAEFARKRDLTISALRRMGVRIDTEPQGTFYVWGSLADLPAPLDTGEGFFRAALQHKVITVPGELFDIDPGRRRQGPRWYGQWMRFSYGPSHETVTEGLDRLAAMVAEAS